MKTTILSAFICLCLSFFSIKALGQIEKGNYISTLGVYLDINSGHGSSDTKEEKRATYNISLQQGYFISKNFALGLGYEHVQNTRNQTYQNNGYIKDKSFSNKIYVYGQYYKNIHGKFFYSPSISAYYFNQKGNFKRKDPGFNETISTYNRNNWGLQANPAQFSYIISRHFLVEAGFCYLAFNSGKGKNISPDYTEEGQSKSLTLNFSPSISSIKFSVVF